ncbi:hypothetical protein [Microbacterium sp. NPDC091662]|uniref:hypothetical protein n=1 Tax=Microbacterium sp. NPDC091662 TaxID=3364211 RepID=UPI003812D386
MRAPRPMPTTRLEVLLGRRGAVVALWLSAALTVAVSALLWGAALERPLATSLAPMVPILVSPMRRLPWLGGRSAVLPEEERACTI